MGLSLRTAPRRLEEVYPVQAIACIAARDPDVRTMLATTLQLMGYKTHETESSELALFIADQLQLSLLLVDVVMPDTSGLDVIRQVRAMAPGVRIVALSDGGRAGLPLFCELAYHAGTHVALAAPFSPASVCAAVHEAWHDDPAHEPWASPAIAQRGSAQFC